MTTTLLNAKYSYQNKKLKQQAQISSPFKFKFIVPVNSIAQTSSSIHINNKHFYIENKLHKKSSIKSTNNNSVFNTVCDYQSSINNSCSSKQQLFFNFLSQRDISDKKDNSSFINRFQHNLTSSKNRKQEIINNSHNEDSIGKYENNSYLRKVLEKKDEEINKLKEEIKYYKNRYTVLIKHYQRESNSFDADYKFKTKQFQPDTIVTSEDALLKNNSAQYNKQYFIHPNKIFISHTKSANKLKYKNKCFTTKNNSHFLADESNEEKNKTEYICEHNGGLSEYNNVLCKNQNIVIQKSFEHIKKRMNNLLCNIQKFNKGKEVNNK